LYDKHTQIIQTASGKWLRFPNHFKQTPCLVELPDQLAISVDIHSGSIHVHKIDHEQVYQHIGDVAISASRNHIHTSVKGIAKYDQSDSVFRENHSGHHQADQAKTLGKEESA
jgi:hypothetical protein